MIAGKKTNLLRLNETLEKPANRSVIWSARLAFNSHAFYERVAHHLAAALVLADILKEAILNVAGWRENGARDGVLKRFGLFGRRERRLCRHVVVVARRRLRKAAATIELVGGCRLKSTRLLLRLLRHFLKLQIQMCLFLHILKKKFLASRQPFYFILKHSSRKQDATNCLYARFDNKPTIKKSTRNLQKQRPNSMREMRVRWAAAAPGLRRLCHRVVFILRFWPLDGRAAGRLCHYNLIDDKHR